MWKLGIVDFDSSHSVEFTRRFNHIGVSSDQFVEGARVVAGWPGSSVMGAHRIPGFLAEMKSFGIEIVDRAEDLLGRVDAVLALSMCGAAHGPRVKPFLEAGIPVFVDKPFASSMADALDMIEMAERLNVPLFNASALRYTEEVLHLEASLDRVGPLHGLLIYGPGKRADGNPGLLHYGVHSVEALLHLMGPGCQAVQCSSSAGADLVTGFWSDGRLGSVRANRLGSTAYGYVAFCHHGVVTSGISTQHAYRHLCQRIVTWLETKVAPVSHSSSLDVMRFCVAALHSEFSHGAVVPLDDTLLKSPLPS